MSTLHFIYAGELGDSRIQSPYSITKNLHNYLSQRCPVKYYRWDSTEQISVGPNDIVLGHPNYPANTPTRQAFTQPCRAKCLIHPFHHNRASDNLPFDDLASQADRIFSICGPYWYDSVDQTGFAHWKPKMVRVDMAVDANVYPYLKQDFNRKRRLLYVGSSTPNKNLGLLYKIMKHLPDVELHWYGGSREHPLARLPNVRTTGWVTLDHKLAERICQDCDVMVSVSDSDANPTTLLETMAWGLIVACTKESGYYNDPLFTELYLDDFQATIQQIRGLLAAPADQLRERSKAGRSAVEATYNWDRFCQTVWDGIRDLL